MGIAAMGMNPFFPQQLFQDALAMSQPVEAADEPILVQTLLSAKKRNESYKDALNTLHGRNGHSSSLWKDYYLDHKDHIDTWINMCLEKEKSQSATSKVVKLTSKPDRKPPLPSIKKEFSPARLPVSAPKRRKHSVSSTGTTPIPSASGRATLNSLAGPAPVYNDRLPPSHAEIKIPEPPSRSPSPPTRVIPAGRGNKYTEEDRQFFLKFISWRLKQDSSLTRNDLCNMLAEKAPHHTPQSWASHWSNRHDLPDKILAAARGESLSDDEDEDEDEILPIKDRPKLDENSSDEDESVSDVSSDDADDEPVEHCTESDMGRKGEPFTNADLYMVAKHAAKYSAWSSMPSKDRWDSFTERFPQRSSKSWAEYYRRNETPILKLCKKLRKEMAREVLPQRCARPSRPLGKRKYTSDDEEDDKRERNRESSEDA